MKKIFGKVLGIFSDDLGIDLGTSNTLICVKNKGIIMNAPSVVAINTKTKDIFEVGDKAKQMIGRTPHTVEAIRPLKNGVIADYEITEKMLREFYKIVNRGKSLSSPRVIICVPAGVTQVEKKSRYGCNKRSWSKRSLFNRRAYGSSDRNWIKYI